MVQQHEEKASTHSALTLFYCYARKDQTLRDEIDVHLASLHRSGLVTSWHDAMIVPGADWEHEIDTHLNAASIILLLISPDFLNSDYCYSQEMQRAIEQHKKGEAHVIPILLRPVDWENTPFSTLQMLPTDAKPVTQWIDQDAAFADIARGIRRVVNDIIDQKRLQEGSEGTRASHVHFFDQARKDTTLILNEQSIRGVPGSSSKAAPSGRPRQRSVEAAILSSIVYLLGILFAAFGFAGVGFGFVHLQMYGTLNSNSISIIFLSILIVGLIVLILLLRLRTYFYLKSGTRILIIISIIGVATLAFLIFSVIAPVIADYFLDGTLFILSGFLTAAVAFW